MWEAELQKLPPQNVDVSATRTVICTSEFEISVELNKIESGVHSVLVITSCLLGPMTTSDRLICEMNSTHGWADLRYIYTFSCGRQRYCKTDYQTPNNLQPDIGLRALTTHLIIID